MNDSSTDAWNDVLITEAHAYVDKLRKAKGLPPWKWHKPKMHRISDLLEDLIRIVDKEGNEVRDYSCKECAFIGSSPNSMHDHFVENPSHKKGYIPKKVRALEVSNGVAEDRTRARSRTNHSARPLSAFEQLHALLDTFNAEIAQELNTLKTLQGEIDARTVRLDELKSARNVLAMSTGRAGETTEKASDQEPFYNAVPIPQSGVDERDSITGR